MQRHRPRPACPAGDAGDGTGPVAEVRVQHLRPAGDGDAPGQREPARDGDPGRAGAAGAAPAQCVPNASERHGGGGGAAGRRRRSPRTGWTQSRATCSTRGLVHVPTLARMGLRIALTERALLAAGAARRRALRPRAGPRPRPRRAPRPRAVDGLARARRRAGRAGAAGPGARRRGVAVEAAFGRSALGRWPSPGWTSGTRPAPGTGRPPSRLARLRPAAADRVHRPRLPGAALPRAARRRPRARAHRPRGRPLRLRQRRRRRLPARASTAAAPTSSRRGSTRPASSPARAGRRDRWCSTAATWPRRASTCASSSRRSACSRASSCGWSVSAGRTSPGCAPTT